MKDFDDGRPSSRLAIWQETSKKKMLRFLRL